MPWRIMRSGNNAFKCTSNAYAHSTGKLFSFLLFIKKLLLITHKTLATHRPTPTQSTNTTQNKNFQNPKSPRCRAIANPIEETVH